MVRHDGHVLSETSVLRILRDEGLILPVEYQREMFGRPLVEASPVDPEAGKLLPVVAIVTDNGGPFRSFRFESFITAHPELVHVRTRVKTPGQNGSRERGFGTLKYERLYLDEIDDALAPSGPRPTGSSTTNSGLMRPSHGTGPKRCIRDWPPRTPQHSKPKKPCQLLDAGHSV